MYYWSFTWGGFGHTYAASRIDPEARIPHPAGDYWSVGWDESLAATIRVNVDGPGDVNTSAFRWRHSNNTKLNMLMADGHVESKGFTEVVWKNVLTPAPQ